MSIRILFFAILLIILPAHAFADDVVDGQIGPGSIYRMIRPPAWNGSLVLFIHGDVYSTSTPSLPAEAFDLYALIRPYGFAIAFSSFSETGWAVKDGAQRTHQLLNIFISTFGQPRRVYLTGGSMGGLIALKLAEDHPGLFSGVLPACAASAGAQALFDYYSHSRALFDFFYPGVLPGNAGNIPPGTDPLQSVFLPAVSAMQQAPAFAFAIAAVTQSPVPFSTPAELIQSIATAVGAHAQVFPDLIARTHGQPYFDNSRTRYTGALSPLQLAAINAGVSRFRASPSALNYLDHNDDLSGDLHIPTLMLSNAVDPITPGFNLSLYAGEVAAAGNSNFLVQRQVNTYGHCVFTPAELSDAFLDLVGWVEFGVKPTP